MTVSNQRVQVVCVKTGLKTAPNRRQEAARSRLVVLRRFELLLDTP